MSDLDEYGLSHKQRRYVERYIIDFDEDAACEEAGFDKGMLPAIRSHPVIKAAIEELGKQRIEKLKLTQDDVEVELSKMAKPTFDDFYVQDENGKFKVRADIKPEHMAAIKEIRNLPDGSQQVVLYDRRLVLDMHMRKHGAYVNRHKFEGQIDHKHTHEITAQSLIEEMNQLLLKRPPKVIDVEPEPDADVPGQ